MLKEFIRGLVQEPNPKDLQEQERVKQMTQIFDGLVNFLKESDTFPNKEINKLATLMWRLIGNKHIPVVLDPTGRMPSVSFAVLSNQVEPYPFLIIPQNFIELVQEAPEVEIGVFAYMGSQCRDYFCGKINGKNGLEINRRAQAYEAEALLTLRQIAEQEGLQLRLIPFQEEILRNFPNGLADLEEKLVYPTPEYNPLWSQDTSDPMLN